MYFKAPFYLSWIGSFLNIEYNNNKVIIFQINSLLFVVTLDVMSYLFLSNVGYFKEKIKPQIGRQIWKVLKYHDSLIIHSYISYLHFHIPYFKQDLCRSHHALLVFVNIKFRSFSMSQRFLHLTNKI